MNNEITALARDYANDSFFTKVPVTDSMIEAAQGKLGIVLPGQYVDYLKTFGHGGIGGVEILGFGFDGSAMFIDDTLEYREFGLPKNLVVVENVDEWLYCLDCDTGKVVPWCQGEEVRSATPNFDEFVLDEFKDAIDNM
ncbi:SMI1/KNR4 family protein [Olsenella uli]|uniref:SMI1/KNR4 family protein n=1 Tax=Olsenella uli TaxID=133926 RepID=UPI003D7976A9